MFYHYKMLQIPPSISVQKKEYRGNEAAGYLQEIVNAEATQGWEFYRVDEIGTWVNPGCLRMLFGQKSVSIPHYVVTFRREA
ncbi:MAG TPA: DUF4177 domain-containing protein [Blastocatellia bacterium]|nr:DUF4177 domain-containing protein [Blastocatellia bacterium]